MKRTLLCSLLLAIVASACLAENAPPIPLDSQRRNYRPDDADIKEIIAAAEERMREPPYPNVQRDNRYSRGTAVFDGYIQTAGYDLHKERPNLKVYSHYAYADGRIAEYYQAFSDKPDRLLRRYWYSEKQEPVLSVRYGESGDASQIHWADFDASSRPVRIVWLSKDGRGTYQLTASTKFDYHELDGERELIVRSDYKRDGTPSSSTLWMNDELWTGQPGQPLHKANNGSRELHLRIPERHGLKPYYPLPE